MCTPCGVSYGDRCRSAGLLQGVLSVWKLRVGVEAYYLAQVASGLDDYYTGAGEAVGEWTGHGSIGVGLAGRVDAADLRAVLAGLAPDTGLTPNGTQNSPHARRVPGFDLTFSVPKSVSVLYALADPLVQGTVIDAAETALAETLAWLEREAAFVRRGSNKQDYRLRMGDDWGTRRTATGGFVAAQFRHRSSRAGDPHLHWHVLVANLAQGIDGRWSALDGTALYAAKRTAGVLFQTALRKELAERLGVEWGPVRNDSAEIAGIPRCVVRLFSQRREQMEEWLQANGRSGPAAAAAAMLATRTAKPDTTFAALTAEWCERASAAGFGPDDLDALLTGRPAAPNSPGERWTVPAPPAVSNDATTDAATEQTTVLGDFDGWLDHLLEHRLTANESTFTRFTLTQAVAAAMPSGTGIGRVEQVVDRCLASTQVVPIDAHEARLHGPLGTIGDDRACTYTSRRLLEIENRFLGQITSERETAPLDHRLVEQMLAARPTIGFDQAHALRLLTQPDAVQVMVGRPGTGKTYTLGTLRSVYEQAGWDVLGLAPSARAARELEDGAGIASRTIASFLHHPQTLTPSSVVVIDEAGMAGTRDLAAVVDHVAAARAKVILVGDQHQLAEVAAGGAFRAALDALSPVPGLVCELTVNRRQRHAWEHDALDLLRGGDIPAAWAAYKAHDRVVLTDTPTELHARMVADWRQLTDQPLDGHPADVIVLAGTRAETGALNRAIRTDRIATGEVSGAALVVGERSFQTGDRVVLLRNNNDQHDTAGNRIRVDNGMVGDITAIDYERGRLSIRLKGPSGREVVIDRAYLTAGHVDHGYALTVHKAQGLTCDHVLIAGPYGLNREAGYVALSRARHSAHIYATVRQDQDLTERHARGIPLPTEAPLDPETELVARLARSGAKQLATVANPDARRIDDLAATHPVTELVNLAAHARQVRDTAPCAASDSSEFDAAVAFRSHAEIGRRVRALDRDNVGTIEGIVDHHGTVTVRFENALGRSSRRTFDWHQILVIDNPQPVTLTDDAVEHLEALAGTIEWRRHQWNDHHRRHGVEPGDADRYDAAIELVVERATRQLRADPPEWLDHMIGQRPTDQARAVVWDDTVHRIADWRTRHNIPSQATGLGPAPDEGTTFEEWHRLAVEILDIAAYLATAPSLGDQRSTLTPGQLLARRDELRQLIETAPPADRAVIDQILHPGTGPGELQAQLAATIDGRGERVLWILEHWPHIVELEQIERIIAGLDPLVLWPAAQPHEVQAVLDLLRQIPEAITEREPRSLAELAKVEADASPLARLQHRIADLAELAAEIDQRLQAEPSQYSVDDRATLERELRRLRAELGDAERLHADESLLYDYVGPSEESRRARLIRAANVSHAALTKQPDWVTDYVRELHDDGRLAASPVRVIAERIGGLAVRADGGEWTTPSRDLDGPSLSPIGDPQIGLTW